MTEYTFDSWLRAQANRRDPIGSLAQDYRADCNAHGLTSMTAAELRASMLTQCACSGAMQALTIAQREWNQQLRRERQEAQHRASLARAAQSRPRAHSLPLTNAAGHTEAPLETTPAESE
ncbi:hypothetical protein CVS30_03820 [Arthrobacter psychrolactophilus]|uniref:Uncharacterized protein n=2 Tax=Arthrobacter psychrolactophilus TaxID=92442 RepID=A0A2V5JI32_9MICC|nr:hypothetical protein CVS30_03820 [Arthrobacter psychrolactophilus]